MYPVSCPVDVQMAQAKQDGTTHVVFFHLSLHCYAILLEGVEFLISKLND
jgi:hypothetical protein